MKTRLMQELKTGFLLFSVIFTLTTLVSSALQLFSGQAADTNFHILNRGAIVLIAVLTIRLFDTVRFSSKVLSYLVPYAISLAVVLAYVWASGWIEPLHPDAYRDIFLNFTAVAVVVMIAISIKDRWVGGARNRS